MIEQGLALRVSSRSPDLDPCEMLAAAVIADAIKGETPRWLCDPCAIWWCQLVDLDPGAMYKIAVQGTRWKDVPYQPYKKCMHKKIRGGV